LLEFGEDSADFFGAAEFGDRVGDGVVVLPGATPQPAAARAGSTCSARVSASFMLLIDNGQLKVDNVRWAFVCWI
jgi:hypothetical protein